MERLVVFWTNWKSIGATPSYKILVFGGQADGNPEERGYRVGDRELRGCLETEYSLDPKVVDSIFLKLAVGGEAKAWVEAVPA